MDDTAQPQWDKATAEKFRLMLDRVPPFLRPAAEKKVGDKAVSFAVGANRAEVTEKDMVDAFFAATPFGFHGPMKSDMESLGINYTQYGYQR